MTVEPWEFALVALAAYRITRFIVVDSLLGRTASEDEPRGSGLRLRLDQFAYDDEGEDRSWLRGKVGDLLTCSWCLGFWVSVATLAAWTADVEWLRWAVTGFAVAGAQGFVASRYNA